MELHDFNKKLARTFVKDFGIPVSITTEADFFYTLHAYENEGLWRFFVNTVNSFPGTFESQVQQFYEERDKLMNDLIDTISSKPEYIAFNTSNMNIYTIKYPELHKSDDKRNYISIDLKSANVQALYYANPEITFGKNTWEDLVYEFNGHNTMSSYIIMSKHFRQVLFGKLNPKRAITVEKYIMMKILDFLKEYQYNMDLVAFNNDELVFSTTLSLEAINSSNMLDNIKHDIHDKLSFVVKAEAFECTNLRLRNLSNYNLTQCFQLNKYNDGTLKTKNIPGYLYGIIYQLLRGREVNDKHKHFVNDNMDCLIIDNFVLCDEDGNEINQIIV